jgi:hypothetical protein
VRKCWKNRKFDEIEPDGVLAAAFSRGLNDGHGWFSELPDWMETCPVGSFNW